ncbi:MAG: hypothetical protein ACK5NT_12605 [Pyrinomonadaceae bacterium]
MNTKLNRISLLLLVTVFSAFTAFAQEKFSDPNVEYEFMIPNDNWKMIVKPSEFSPNVEYVYKDRDQGYLQIRKLSVDKDATFSSILQDEELKLQFMPGYVAGKEENFTGNYDGKVFNYEYVKAGKNMSGRNYYLRTDSTTVYALRFTGLKDSLRLLRNETDSIARTFTIKK